MHQLIDEAGYQDDIFITSTIYDSIYFEVRKDPQLVKWLNDNLIPIMKQDFMIDQLIHNDVDLEIGSNWADLHKIDNSASLSNIKDLIHEFC